MKFIIVQCVKAYSPELENILKTVKIDAYSEMDVEGFMKNVNGNPDFSNWFGYKKNPYRYMISFMFLTDDKADELLTKIDEFNQSIEEISPIHAYIVGVEKSV